MVSLQNKILALIIIINCLNYLLEICCTSGEIEFSELSGVLV